MSMQDLKACRDYVLNLQDEKNLQQVRHEATKKELALVKEELAAEMKRNTELQNEAAQLLMSWSRAQSQQQEYDQQILEVRDSLKRKTEDIAGLKRKMTDEESSYLERYRRLLVDVIGQDSSMNPPGSEQIKSNERNTETSESVKSSVEDVSNNGTEGYQYSKQEIVVKDTKKSEAANNQVESSNDLEVTVNPKIQESIRSVQAQLQESFERTIAAITDLIQGLENPAAHDRYRDLFDDLIFPEQCGLLSELYHIINALQLDQSATQEYAECDPNEGGLVCIENPQPSMEDIGDVHADENGLNDFTEDNAKSV